MNHSKSLSERDIITKYIDKCHIIKHKKIDKSYEIYLAALRELEDEIYRAA